LIEQAFQLYVVRQIRGMLRLVQKRRLDHPGMLEQRISGLQSGSRPVLSEPVNPIFAFACLYFRTASIYESPDVCGIHESFTEIASFNLEPALNRE
jgi:hypothetical protein